MNKNDLLSVIEPISGFSVLNKYNLPWLWFISNGYKVSSIFSDGGGIVAECTLPIQRPVFAYKVNGVMLMRAVSTLPDDDDVKIESNNGKMIIRSGRSKAELPVYEIGDSVPSVTMPKGTSNISIPQAEMIKLVKFAKLMGGNIYFRKEGTAGCYARTTIYTINIRQSNADIIIPDSIVRSLNYLGEDIDIFQIDDQRASIITGNIAITYLFGRHVDYRLDRRAIEANKEIIGKMNTPKFSNFRACGAKNILWDGAAGIVKQFDVAELMYEEKIDGELNGYFVTPLIPELNEKVEVLKLSDLPVTCFDFGSKGMFAVSQIHHEEE